MTTGVMASNVSLIDPSSVKGVCGLKSYRDQVKCVMLCTQDIWPSGLICSLIMHDKVQ